MRNKSAYVTEVLAKLKNKGFGEENLQIVNEVLSSDIRVSNKSRLPNEKKYIVTLKETGYKRTLERHTAEVNATTIINAKKIAQISNPGYRATSARIIVTYTR